jgi:transposase
MIRREQYAQIRRLYFAEHWKVGTIARELGLHPDTVARAVEVDRFGATPDAPRPSILDPYKPFIVATLEKHPRLRSTRLHEMLATRGYAGGLKTVRRYVRTVRPPRSREAYLALETMPGEQGQVDWAHFGKVDVDGARRVLWCFVMVLSFSRALFARFTFDASQAGFLRGHRMAFERLGGAPRVLLYDNLKSAVLDRVGSHVRFHPRLLELAGHYHFEPRPCAPYRGNEKGKVERTIQYLRHSFFAARRFADLDDLNAQLDRWTDEVAHARVRPTDPDDRTVADCLADEQEHLVPLPAHPFVTDHVVTARSGKRPYLRFDQNDYSIPHRLIRAPLTLVATEDVVRVLDGTDEVARHRRSYGRKRRVEDANHLEALARDKRAASELSGRDRLRASCPHAPALLEEMARRGEALRHHTFRLNRLLDRYGVDALDRAIAEALDRGAPSVGAVAHLCDAHHRRKGRPPPVAAVLPDDPRVRDVIVGRHDLGSYDQLVRDDGDDGSPGGTHG